MLNLIKEILKSKKELFFPYCDEDLIKDIDLSPFNTEILLEKKNPIAFMVWLEDKSVAELLYFYTSKPKSFISTYFFSQRFYTKAVKGKTIKGEILKTNKDSISPLSKFARFVGNSHYKYFKFPKRTPLKAYIEDETKIVKSNVNLLFAHYFKEVPKRIVLKDLEDFKNFHYRILIRTPNKVFEEDKVFKAYELNIERDKELKEKLFKTYKLLRKKFLKHNHKKRYKAQMLSQNNFIGLSL